MEISVLILVNLKYKYLAAIFAVVNVMSAFPATRTIIEGAPSPLEMTDIAMENGPVEIVRFPMKNGALNHGCVNLPFSHGFPWFSHGINQIS